MPDTPVFDARVRLPIDLRPTHTAPPVALRRQRYDQILDMADKVSAGTTSALLESLREQGISRAVVHAEYEGLVDTETDVEVLNTATTELVAQHPQVLSGFGTITMPPPTAGSAEGHDRADLDRAPIADLNSAGSLDSRQADA